MKLFCKVASDFAIGKYRVLKLDGEKPKTRHTKYVIGGKVYKIVPIYEASNCIAVEADETLKGKRVEFV